MDSTTKHELEKMTFVASTIAPGPMQLLLGLIKLIEILLGWLSVTTEVFIRFSFGERYLSLLRLLLAWWTFQAYRFFYFFIGALFGLSDASTMDWFLGNIDFGNLFNNSTSTRFYVMFVYSFAGLSLLHLLVIWKRGQDGRPWHTKSFGISWLEFLPWGIWHWVLSFIPISSLRKGLAVNDWKLYCILEPLICYQAALWLKSYDQFLGSWLLIASVALFLKNNMVYFEMRGRILDMMDAQIEGQYLQESLAGADKRETAGFSVVPAPLRFETTEMNIAATVQETLSQKSNDTDSQNVITQIPNHVVEIVD